MERTKKITPPDMAAGVIKEKTSASARCIPGRRRAGS